MPHSKLSQKHITATERERLRNKSIRSLCKTNIIKAEKLIFSGEIEPAREAVVVAISSLDKAAKKGTIHRNNASQRKSRLMTKLNEAIAMASVKNEASAETEPEEAA